MSILNMIGGSGESSTLSTMVLETAETSTDGSKVYTKTITVPYDTKQAKLLIANGCNGNFTFTTTCNVGAKEIARSNRKETSSNSRQVIDEYTLTDLKEGDVITLTVTKCYVGFVYSLLSVNTSISQSDGTYVFPDGTNFKWSDVKFGTVQASPRGGRFVNGNALDVIPLIVRSTDLFIYTRSTCKIQTNNGIVLHDGGGSYSRIYGDYCVFSKCNSLNQLKAISYLTLDAETDSTNSGYLDVIAWLEK